MANKTPIEWCRTYSETADPQRSDAGSFTEGYSVNPVRFRPHGSERMVTMCQKVSPGCAHCYAETISRRFWPKDAKRRVAHRLTMGTELIPISFPGYTAGGVSEHSGEFVLDEKTLRSVLKIKVPAKVFWGDMTDLFGEWVKDEWLDRMFAVCALTPHLTHIWLTKRPERMLAYLASGKHAAILDAGSLAIPDIDPRANPGARTRIAWQLQKLVPVSEWGKGNVAWPLPNVWLGVSVENQKAAEERIPQLLQTPAAVRFLSVEPMLEALEISGWCAPSFVINTRGCEKPMPADLPRLLDKVAKAAYKQAGGALIDWVICGGESGPGARPMHPEWARSLRDQCLAAGVPFFFKQWGEFTSQVDAFNLIEPWRYLHLDGLWVGEAEALADGGLWQGMYRIGKKAAGRLLDGREWNQFPEVTRET